MTGRKGISGPTVNVVDNRVIAIATLILVGIILGLLGRDRPMSRFEWDDYGDPIGYNNGPELFYRRAVSAIYGRKGRKALAQLREALMALPKHELIEGAVCRRLPAEDLNGDPIVYEAFVEPGQLGIDGSEVTEPQQSVAMPPQVVGVCAIGAWLWWSKVKEGTDPVKAFDELPEIDSDSWDIAGDEMFETAWAGQRAGLTYTLAWELASGNDETFEGMEPAARWQAFVDWIDKVLASPPLPRGHAPQDLKRLGQSWSA